MTDIGTREVQRDQVRMQPLEAWKAQACPQLSPDSKVYLSEVYSVKNFVIGDSYAGDVADVRNSCSYVDTRVLGNRTFITCYNEDGGVPIPAASNQYTQNLAQGGTTARGPTAFCPLEMCDLSAQFMKRDRLQARQWTGTRNQVKGDRTFRKRRGGQ